MAATETREEDLEDRDKSDDDSEEESPERTQHPMDDTCRLR